MRIASLWPARLDVLLLVLLLLLWLHSWLDPPRAEAINCQPCKLLEARKAHANETLNNFKKTQAQFK